MMPALSSTPNPAPFIDRRAGDEDRRRRGGRPPVTVRPLTMFAAPTGHPVKLAELQHHAGCSRDKLLADIDTGALIAKKVACGRRFEYRVAFADAQRYLRACGALPTM